MSKLKKILVVVIIDLLLGAAFISFTEANIEKKYQLNDKCDCLQKIDDGLVGYWKFNEGSGDIVLDYSGFNNHGKNNGATWIDNTNDEDCRFALDFDGVDDYVEIFPNSSINVFGKNEITIGAWIYPRSAGENNYGRIIDKANETSDDDGVGFKFGLYGIDQNNFKLSAKVQHNITNALTLSSGLFPFNKWYFVAFVYNEDGNKAIKIYINGLNESGIQIFGEGHVLDDSDVFLKIGNFALDSIRTFDGAIDEVKIWNKALNSSSIWDLSLDPCKSDEGPDCIIWRPIKGHLYRNNNDTGESIDGRTIIYGRIEVWVIAESQEEIEKVEFYIDDSYKAGVSKKDEGFYKWWLTETTGISGKDCTLKVMVYDINGKTGECKLDVFYRNVKPRNIYLNIIYNLLNKFLYRYQNSKDYLQIN